MRGRGLKFTAEQIEKKAVVALFARAWIEIIVPLYRLSAHNVALFARAWIEILPVPEAVKIISVALFARAWIEITS